MQNSDVNIRKQKTNIFLFHSKRAI